MQQTEDLKKDPELKETIKFSDADVTKTETLDRSTKPWLINHYSNNVQSYSLLLKEYDQSKHRNTVSYGLSSFPSIENWIPKGRLISNDEKMLLCGPTLEVKSIKRIQVCTPITRRWVTYVSAKYEQSLKVSSCYVALKKYSSRTPQFGKIENLFLHSFADKTTVICEIVLFESPTYNEETAMWHVSSTPKPEKSLHLLEDLSLPLVTAMEESQVWFLNYTI